MDTTGLTPEAFKAWLQGKSLIDNSAIQDFLAQFFTARSSSIDQFEDRLLPFMVKTGQWVGKKSLPGCQLSGCNLKIILIFVQSCLESEKGSFKILALATDQKSEICSVYR